jgi:hypothetical protein
LTADLFTMRLSEADRLRLDRVVEEGGYASRADAIKTLIAERLALPRGACGAPAPSHLPPATCVRAKGHGDFHWSPLPCVGGWL